MFSLQIVDTDAFMNMPLSTQALYFHLGMRADDDGFVSNARRVQKLVGASDDDLNLLLLRRFVLAFESGVMVIKHWKISNYIQKDRYRPTLYKEEKATLYLKSDGAYTDHYVEGAKPLGTTAPPALPEPVSNMDTDCLHRLGEERIGEVRSGEERLGEFSSGGGDTRAHTRESAEQEVAEYMQERQLDPSFSFGVTAEVLGDVALLAEAIFKRFTTRRPTEADIANVFMCIRHQEYDTIGGSRRYRRRFYRRRRRGDLYLRSQ